MKRIWISNFLRMMSDSKNERNTRKLDDRKMEDKGNKQS